MMRVATTTLSKQDLHDTIERMMAQEKYVAKQKAKMLSRVKELLTDAICQATWAMTKQDMGTDETFEGCDVWARRIVDALTNMEEG
jgi:Txe/YoeB family toxin of Txe-Axe toxin-antitoxin module